MVWLYIAIATVGIVILVPSVLQTIDGMRPSPVMSFAGFTLTTLGITGAFVSQFPGGWAAHLVASAAIGLAAGAVHPELLSWLTTRRQDLADDAVPEGLD